MNFEAEKNLVRKFIEEHTYVNKEGDTCNYSDSQKKEITKQFENYMHGGAYEGRFKTLEEFFVDIEAVDKTLSLIKGRNGKGLADDSIRKRYGNISSFLKYLKNNTSEKYTKKITEMNQKVYKTKQVIFSGQAPVKEPTEDGLRTSPEEQSPFCAQGAEPGHQVETSHRNDELKGNENYTSDSIGRLEKSDSFSDITTTTTTNFNIDLFDETKYMKITRGNMVLFVPKEDFIEYAINKFRERFTTN